MRWLTLGSLAVLAAACVTPLPHATAADASRAQLRWPQATVASLEEGRRLFAFRCSGCHGLPLPSRYPLSEWPRIFDEMQSEARLTAAERATIEQFILTIAARPPPAAADARAPTPPTPSPSAPGGASSPGWSRR